MDPSGWSLSVHDFDVPAGINQVASVDVNTENGCTPSVLVREEALQALGYTAGSPSSRTWDWKDLGVRSSYLVAFADVTPLPPAEAAGTDGLDVDQLPPELREALRRMSARGPVVELGTGQLVAKDGRLITDAEVSG